MPKYIVERRIRGAGDLTEVEWQTIAQRSCDVVRSLAGDVQWLESFVTPDKTYCVYIASSADVIREHAERAGVPVDAIEEVTSVIDPTTGEPVASRS